VGLFDLATLWTFLGLITLQQCLPMLDSWRRRTHEMSRFSLGNPIGARFSLFVACTALGVLLIYVATYLYKYPQATWVGGSTGFAALLGTIYQMYHYHMYGVLTATHPYSSKWWTWPLELRPMSYYYTALSGLKPPNQIVAEIIALPNPFVWLVGVATVPLAGWIAIRERHRGMMLCVLAYFMQWVPWIGSPRIDFIYNFFPNVAVICLCSTYVLAKIWAGRIGGSRSDFAMRSRRLSPTQIAVLCYLAVCVWGFIYFLPIYSAAPISYDAWRDRMWLPYGWPYGWI
jgi:hypothetical protein